MNKIAIVGHPASGYEEVLALLHRCGMARALPSRREGLLPQDITATLCKAHKAPPLDTVTDEDALTQIDAGPVWQGMALDLMLGNLDQPLWGWADPLAIYALDYWAGLDPQLTFVLVYDEPHRVLMDAARKLNDAGDAPPSGQELRRLLDNWAAYNGALLRFHLRHAGRSLLVHVRQAYRAIDRYVQQLQPMLDAPLAIPVPEELNEPEAEHGEAGRAIAHGAAALPAVLSQAVVEAGASPQEAAALFGAEAAERYLVDEVLSSHPRALQLYAELQSAANLPLDRDAHAAAGNPALAWEALARQRAFVTRLLLQIHAKHQIANESLTQTQARLALYQAEIEGQVAKLRAAQAAAEEARSQAETDHSKSVVAELESKQNELREENELLLSQLHQVQEELERYYLENRRLKERLSPPKPSGPYGAAERIKRQLGYRLGAVMVKRSHTLGGWLGMIPALRAEVKAFRRDEKARKGEKLPPLDQYMDAHEAERVKQHLSYKLGQALVRHGKTPWGWVMLPFALIGARREFVKQKNKGTS